MEKYCLGTITNPSKVLWDGTITATGSYQLSGNINDYERLIVCYNHSGVYETTNTIYVGRGAKNLEGRKYINVYGVNASNAHAIFYFNQTTNTITVSTLTEEYITKIIGV